MALVVVLLAIWFVGFTSGFTAAGMIHLLPVIATVVLVVGVLNRTAGKGRMNE